MATQAALPILFGSYFVKWDSENKKYVWVQKSDISQQPCKIISTFKEGKLHRIDSKTRVLQKPMLEQNHINKSSQDSLFHKVNVSLLEDEWSKEWLLRLSKIPDKENVEELHDCSPHKANKVVFKLSPKKLSSKLVKSSPTVNANPLAPKVKNLLKLVNTKRKSKMLNYSPIHSPHIRRSMMDQTTEYDLQQADEILSSHDTMTTILSTRLLRLRAAKVTWQQNPESLVSYVLRISDPSNTIDLLPILTTRLTQEPLCLSVGSCLELLALQSNLLSSRYEDYIRKSLDFLLAIISKCRTQGNSSGISGHSLEITLLSLVDLLRGLVPVPGRTGFKAKMLLALLSEFSE